VRMVSCILLGVQILKREEVKETKSEALLATGSRRYGVTTHDTVVV